MKINEIKKENVDTSSRIREQIKRKEEEESPKVRKEQKEKNIVKAENKLKDTIHISESKMSTNVLDRKLNILDRKISEPKVEIRATKSNGDKEQVNERELDNVLKKLNTNTDINSKGVRFEKDNYYGKMIVRIYNTETGDEIRQIPSQDMLDFAKKSEEITGILFDKTV